MPLPKGYASVKTIRKHPFYKRLTPPPGDGLTRKPFTLATHLDPYAEWLRFRHRAPEMIESRRRLLIGFMSWCEQRDLLYPRQITRSILESYQRWLFHYRKKNGMPLSIPSQIQRLIAIRGLFGWLCRQRVLEANPASEIDLPRHSRILPGDTLSVAEVEAWLAVPDITDPLGVRDRAMLEVFYSAGLRRSELTRLNVSDLNQENRTLFIRQGKGRKDRMVPVGRRALAWLEKYLVNVRPLLLIQSDEPGLFLSAYGKPFTARSLGEMVRTWLRRANIGRTKGGCHLLRHACATHMLAGGADIRFIQEILGHEHLDTTAIYTRVSIAQLQAVHARTHPAEQAMNADGKP
jgi:integrase/recombinase XerD